MGFNLRYQLIQMKKIKGNISGAQSSAIETLELLEGENYKFKLNEDGLINIEDIDNAQIEML